MAKPTTIDQYLASAPEEMQAALHHVRELIRSIAPSATESISYTMPTFKHAGRPLIYFGAWKDHYAIYGTSAGTVRFKPDERVTEAYVRPLIEERIDAHRTAVKEAAE